MDTLFVPNSILAEEWEKATDSAQGFFNPRTGEVNGSRIDRYLSLAVKSARSRKYFDGLVLAELVLRPAELAGDRVYGDGCSRQIKNQRDDVTFDRYFHGELDGLSLQIRIFDKGNHLVLSNAGAIEFPYYFFEAYHSSEFEWKDTLEFRKDGVNEGIGIAFHPFIRYGDYPTHPHFYNKQDSAARPVLLNPELRTGKRSEEF